MEQSPQHESYVGLPLLQRLRADRPLTSYTKVQAIIGGILRNRWTSGTRRSEYLNVGCGPNVTPGFVNLDYLWRPGVDVCWDLSRPLPFKSETLRGIYTEHCLEHISLEQCAQKLKEFHRMLRMGGTLRIVVPDAEQCVRLYVEIRSGKSMHFPYLKSTPPDWTPIEEVNRLFRNYGHQYAYDFEMMAKLLRAAGFSNITRASYRQGRDDRLLIDTEARRGESLYVEAIK
jgi:predicted SAM-dependent methyltransferase